MSNLIERAKYFIDKRNKQNLFSSSVFAQGADGNELQDDIFKQWYSPDRKKRIVMMASSDPQLGNRYIKDVSLSSTSTLTEEYVLMMRVQAEIKPNGTDTLYAVCIHTLQEDERNNWIVSEVSYFSDGDGRADPSRMYMYIRKNMNCGNLSDEEFHRQFVDEMSNEGVYRESEIPPAIDVEATVMSFMDQIRRLDFSKPILVPKQSLSGAQTTLIASKH